MDFAARQKLRFLGVATQKGRVGNTPVWGIFSYPDTLCGVSRHYTQCRRCNIFPEVAYFVLKNNK
jgi:hypothetical protein